MIDRIALTPVAWSEMPHVDDVRPLGDADHVVLEEIRQVLIKHNATNRFGVTLIHRHFDLQADEVLFETTDEQARTQRVVVKPASEVAGDRVLETQWIFDGSRPAVCIGKCHYDKGHKHYHGR